MEATLSGRKVLFYWRIIGLP